MRERLPDKRNGITHKFILHSLNPSGEVGKLNVYITVNTYPDGRPGELFYTLNISGIESKTVEGKTADILYYECLRGWMKQWAISMSMNLQYGVPLSKIIEKFSYQNFPPLGITENPEIPTCKSITDYTVRWMERQFSPKKAETP